MADLAFALSTSTPALGARSTSTPITAISNKPWTTSTEAKKVEKTWAGSSAALIGGVIAVAGQATRQKARKTRVVNKTLCAYGSFNPENEVGVISPAGFWDPLNLMRENGPTRFQNKPYKSAATFRWYREAELKHGRVSMMALVGLVSGTFFKWPGYEDVPAGLGALESSQGGAGLALLILLAGVFEFDLLTSNAKKEPGALGDNWGIKGDEEKMYYSKEFRNKELAHCRLAMSAIFTAFVLEYNGIPPEVYLSAKSPVLSPYFLVLLIPVFFAWIGGPEPYYEKSVGKQTSYGFFG